jgi:hypothetical protein
VKPLGVETGGMSASELAAAVRETLAVDPEKFREQAMAEAEELKSEVRAGTFDNSQALAGLELELYAVDSRTDALQRMPRQLLGLIGFEKELGLHNAEMQTSPQPLNSDGLATQEYELNAHLDPAIEKVGAENLRLVSDGLWTVPPVGETARDYLSDSVVEEGIRIATNMSDSVRYHAMANTDYPAGLVLDAPHVSLEAETVMPESLTTSIQPHYQVPHAPDLPEYFRYALRVAAPRGQLSVLSAGTLRRRARRGDCRRHTHGKPHPRLRVGPEPACGRGRGAEGAVPTRLRDCRGGHRRYRRRPVYRPDGCQPGQPLRRRLRPPASQTR